MPHQFANDPVSRHYTGVMLDSRTDPDIPHAVIGLLYTELLRSLDKLIQALSSCDDVPEPVTDTVNAERAQSILTALVQSVDFERGGPLAPDLARIYEMAGRELADNLGSGDIGKLRILRDAVSNIAYAWQTLAG